MSTKDLNNADSGALEDLLEAVPVATAGDDLDLDFEEDDLDVLNDPNIAHLDEPPVIGGRGDMASDLYGTRATAGFGRATSPLLFAQASQHPTCVRLRVWKYEDGVPTGLGAVASSATEEDFVRKFVHAMPKRGEGNAMFRLRPLDIRGAEMGQEFTIVIHEHHATITQIREAAEDERDDYVGHPQMVGADSSATETAMLELSRMYERASEAADSRQAALEEALQMERDRIRMEDTQRAQERVDMAMNAAQGMQSLTQRMMQEEQVRSDRAMKSQSEQSNLLITTLTSIFSQQNSYQNQLMENQRRADEHKLEQERQRFERERMDQEARRKRERDEMGSKLQNEQVQMERKFRMEQELQANRWKQEQDGRERKERIEREERERRDRLFMEERERRERRERDEQKERDSERERAYQLRLKEMESAGQRDREHQERMMQLSKQEFAQKQNAGVVDLLPKLGATLAGLGIDPTQAVRSVFAGGDGEDKGGGWLEALPKVLGAVAEVAKTGLQAKGPPPQIAAPPLMGPQMPMRTPPPGAALPPEMLGRQAQRPVVRDAAKEHAVAQAQAEVKQNQAPPTTQELAAGMGMNLKQQKTARTALRDLVRKLKGSEGDKWEDAIAVAVATELSIYHYCQAVSVKRAVMEASAPEEMAYQIMDLMKGSNLVPDDMVYE